MAWVWLTLAGLLEIVWAVGLKYTDGFTRLVPSAITVGAANTKGSLPRSDDEVADYSSRGPTRFELHAKPDIVAPGHAIVSLAVAGSSLQAAYPHLEVASGYFRLNGTSMAAPVVAGAAALMLDGNPGLSAHTVKAVLQFTAQQMFDADAMTQGAGELNVAGAVRVAGAIEELRVETVSGKLDLDATVGEEALLATAEGEIEVRGDIGELARMRVEILNGVARLRLPATLEGRFQLRSFQGELVNELGPPFERQGLRREVSWQQGRSARRVEVESFAGRIELLRR